MNDLTGAKMLIGELLLCKAGDTLRRYYRGCCIRNLAGSIQIHTGVIGDAMPAVIPAGIDTGIAANIFHPRALPRTVGDIARGNTSDL
jgi:hypothetical protein